MSLPIQSKQPFVVFSPSTGLYLGVQDTRLVLSQKQTKQTTWNMINRTLCEYPTTACLNYNLYLEDKADITVNITQHDTDSYLIECLQTKETLAFDSTTGLYWSKDFAIPFNFLPINTKQATFQPKQDDIASLMLELQNTKTALQVCQNKNKKKGCCIS